MNRNILEQPFGPEQIKQREGNFGKMLDYIEGHSVKGCPLFTFCP
jgi:recombination DNA repair RAD52 pathway protein